MGEVEIEGKTRHIVYPGKSERVLRIVRKIIRGLTHYFDRSQIIAEERAHVLMMAAPPWPELEADLHPIYHVPNIANVRNHVFGGAQAQNIHSVWAIQPLEVHFVGVIEPPS
jgi:hypothetical protein